MSRRTCKDCSLKLGFFKKKSKCRQCLYDFCESCFSKVKQHRSMLIAELKKATNVHSCLRCVVLSGGEIQREKLFLLGSKQLTEYLLEHRISISHCKEKYHLIDLIMEFAELHGFKSYSDIENDIVHKGEIEELRRAEIMRQLEEDPIESATEHVFSTSERPCTNSADAQEPSASNTQSSDNNSTHAQQTKSHEPNSLDENLSPVSTASHAGLSNENSGANDEQPVSATSSQHLLNQSNGKWRSLDDIKEESDIASLAVIELKQILKANFIDYRGCCEKKELTDKVKMLYNSKKQQKKANSTNGTDSSQNDRDVCKICMDRTIDCVLLDCGHLVACTKCGKKLAECPICRALVVRVVHIFRV